MDEVTVILGLAGVGALAAIALWATRNKGVVGKRVVVGESTPQITTMAQDGAGEIDPADDWEIIPVTRPRRQREHRRLNEGNAPESLLAEAAPLQEEVIQPDADKTTRQASDVSGELIVVLNLIAHQEQWLDGPSIVNAVRNLGMQYDDPGIFHYVSSEGSQNEPLFSLVNILNPGIFKMDELEQLTTPGVTLFMRLSDAGTANGLDAFARMYDTALQLARALNAEVCDERRLILTESSTSQLRDRIARHQGHLSAH